MKVRRASKPGKVTVELAANDDPLLEKSARAASDKRFQLKRILVPVDFSEASGKALDYALAFAGQFGAKIILLHVTEPIVYPENYVVAPAGADDVNQALLQNSRNRLAEMCTAHQSTDAQVETQVRMGRPFLEIAEAARELESDLIILATHGYTGLKHVLLGSTAERVVRHAPCPVLTVRTVEHDFVACKES